MKTHKSCYDTRFFFELFFADNSETLQKATSDIRGTKERYISAIVLHEVFVASLRKEGRQVAEIRLRGVESQFHVINVDPDVARNSAELRLRYQIPMADSIIAATALAIGAHCVSDDPHFARVKEIRTRWI